MSRFDNNCLWITGRFDDRLSAPVFVHIIGSDAQMCHHLPVDGLLPDEADGTAQFDAIELFHNHKSRLLNKDGTSRHREQRKRHSRANPAMQKKETQICKNLCAGKRKKPLRGGFTQVSFKRKAVSILVESHRKNRNNYFIIRNLYFLIRFF